MTVIDPEAGGDRPFRDWTIGGSARIANRVVPLVATRAAPPWFERDDVFHWTDLFTGRGYRWRSCGGDAGGPHRALGYDQARRTVAVLAGWPDLNTRQLAAFTGHPHTNASRQLLPLFRAGIVERARYPMGLLFGNKGFLYRLHPGPELKGFVRSLSEADRRRVTINMNIGRDRATVRHNLLAAELALRTAELVPGVVAVFPRTVSTPARLLGHLGYTDTWRADFTIVRADGLRIAVELTRARSRRGLEDKMARWARILSRHHWNETGLIVVFVNAACTSEGTPAELRRHHRRWAATQRDAFARVLSVEGLSVPGRRALPSEVLAARSQIHLASWMDWFPAPGEASVAFGELSTVFAAHDREWRREGLADPDGFWGFKPAPVLVDRVNAPALTRRDVFACPRFLAAGDPPAPLRSL